MDNLVNRAMIETAVNKFLHDIKDDSKRGIRNLVDLGSHFATGRFQKDIFAIAQTMLANPESPYYQIVSHLAKHVDHKIIKRFGINIGYNSWTIGAKTIRQREKTLGYNIPWLIVFDFLTDSGGKVDLDDVLEIIRQGKKMGIYSYMFFLGDRTDDVVTVLEQNLDCAFFLFISPEALDPDNVHRIKFLGNTIFLVFSPPDKSTESFSRATGILSKEQCLFGVYCYYDNENVQRILNDQWIVKIQRLHSPLAFLIPKETCSEENVTNIHEYIQKSRENLRYPLYIMDFYEDIAYIDRIISVESCFLGIRSNGNAIVVQNNDLVEFSIKERSLEGILSKAMPKVTYL